MIDEKKPYFHLLTTEELQKAIADKKKYNEFNKPDWCNYDGALDGPYMGCYTLIGKWSEQERLAIKDNKCCNCDSSKFYNKINEVQK